jgi:hypothetical protein
MKRRMYSCLKCGKRIDKRDYLCSDCSPYGGNCDYDKVENPTFLLTNEISEGNITNRLKEGFRLLQ